MVKKKKKKNFFNIIIKTINYKYHNNKSNNTN